MILNLQSNLLHNIEIDDESILLKPMYYDQALNKYGKIIYLMLDDGTNKGFKIIKNNNPFFDHNIIADKYLISIKNINGKNTISYGCDPEFIVSSNNKLLPSKLFFNTHEIGTDGLLAELRPQPSFDYNSLFLNIKKLILNSIEISNKKGYNIDLLGCSFYENQTCGFHLHTCPSNLLTLEYENKYRIITKLIDLLDYYIGLISAYAENTHCQRRNGTNISYGNLGDFRLLDTLEYRVPGGFLLSHPYLTKGLFCMFQLIIESFTNRVNNYFGGFNNINNTDNLLELLNYDILSKNNVCTLYYSENNLKLKKYIYKIFEFFINESKTNQQKQDIMNYYHYCDIQPTYSIKNNWLNN